VGLLSMSAKFVWFLLGALSASVVWILAAIGLSERLLQVFYGFTGH
jgi:arginine exporter protein ArgO